MVYSISISSAEISVEQLYISYDCLFAIIGVILHTFFKNRSIQYFIPSNAFFNSLQKSIKVLGSKND